MPQTSLQIRSVPIILVICIDRASCLDGSWAGVPPAALRGTNVVSLKPPEEGLGLPVLTARLRIRVDRCGVERIVTSKNFAHSRDSCHWLAYGYERVPQPVRAGCAEGTSVWRVLTQRCGSRYRKELPIRLIKLNRIDRAGLPRPPRAPASDRFCSLLRRAGSDRSRHLTATSGSTGGGWAAEGIAQYRRHQRHDALLHALADHAQQPDGPQLRAGVALLHVVRERPLLAQPGAVRKALHACVSPWPCPVSRRGRASRSAGRRRSSRARSADASSRPGVARCRWRRASTR